MVMTTNEAVGLLLAGTIETIVGGTILYGITRKNLHSWLRVWWLPKDSEYSDAIGRYYGCNRRRRIPPHGCGSVNRQYFSVTQITESGWQLKYAQRSACFSGERASQTCS